MHPLRVTLIVSLGIAAVVAFAFNEALHRNGVSQTESAILGACVFVAYLIPWAAVSAWAFRRAADLDRLTDRARRVAGGDYDRPIADREYHGELDDLGRAVEEIRAVVVRQKASFDEQRATMEQIVAALGEGLLALSPRGKVVFANAVVGELFGVPGTLVGRSFLEVVRRQPLVDAFDRAIRGETTAERLSLTSGGRERQIEVRAFPVGASTEIAAVALFIDMTEIERLQRIRKDFLDDFSHEVRTPLAGLRSAAETLEQRGLTAEQEEHLRRIVVRQVGRIGRLVRDLSELNRIESGELVLERADVDLVEIVRDVMEEFRERLAAQPITLTMHGEQNVSASVDVERMQQVIANLIDNASKHGGGGEIAVEVLRDGADAIVRVSDHGSGIPPQDVERIFNRFYRLDKSRSQETPGLGLGLAIAKHLVLLHGGSIRAGNREPHGAEFEVRIPAR
jgi:two-component system phosphate regulon sensor histidine kinase PhoR